MIEIVVDTSALQRSSSGSITGALFVRMDGIPFPDDGWSDFPVVVLGWWVDAVHRLLGGLSEEEELDFMDGPQSLVLKRRDDGAVAIGCRTGQSGLQLDHETVVPESTLRDQVVKAARVVVATCERNGWQGSDVRNLQECIGA